MNSIPTRSNDDDESNPIGDFWDMYGFYLFWFGILTIVFLIANRQRQQGKCCCKQQQLEENRQRQGNGNGQPNVIVVGGDGPQGGIAMQPMQPTVQPYAPSLPATSTTTGAYGGNATMAVVQPVAVPQGNQQPQYAQGPVVMPMAVPNANTY